jgi:hypothetical protein
LLVRGHQSHCRFVLRGNYQSERDRERRGRDGQFEKEPALFPEQIESRQSTPAGSGVRIASFVINELGFEAIDKDFVRFDQAVTHFRKFGTHILLIRRGIQTTINSEAR